MLAAAGNILRANKVAAHLERLVIGHLLAGAEIAHGQAAHVIHIVGHAHGADGVIEVHDDRIVAQLLGVGAHIAQHRFAIVERRHLVQIDDDGFDLLVAHDRAHAAACGQARRAAIIVAKGDARQQSLIFAHGAAKREADLLAVAVVEQRRGFVIALAHVRARRRRMKSCRPCAGE